MRFKRVLVKAFLIFVESSQYLFFFLLLLDESLILLINLLSFFVYTLSLFRIINDQ